MLYIIYEGETIRGFSFNKADADLLLEGLYSLGYQKLEIKSVETSLHERVTLAYLINS